MKYSFSVLACAALASAQSISSLVGMIPSCADSCLVTDIPKVCPGGITDYGCQCANKATLTTDLTPCILKACSVQEALTLQSLTGEICSVYSKMGSGASSAAPTSSAAAASSSAPAYSSSAAAMMTSTTTMMVMPSSSAAAEMTSTTTMMVMPSSTAAMMSSSMMMASSSMAMMSSAPAMATSSMAAAATSAPMVTAFSGAAAPMATAGPVGAMLAAAAIALAL